MKTITYNCDSCGEVIEKDMLTFKIDKNVKHFCQGCVQSTVIEDLMGEKHVELLARKAAERSKDQ